MLQIKINKEGYIEEFMLPGSMGILPDSVKLETFDIDLEDFKINFKAYKFDGTKLFRDNDILSSVLDEKEKIELRSQRERECFKFINRGPLWYNTLTESQITDLTKWYKDWLDVTETKVIPTKPEWLE